MSKHYHAIKTDLGFQIIPVSREALYITGSYLKEEKTFKLFHPATLDDFKFIPKVDSLGFVETKKTKGEDGKMVDSTTYDRKQLKSNFTFDLQDENIDWFLANYVDNAAEAKAWMTEEAIPEPQIPLSNKMEVTNG